MSTEELLVETPSGTRVVKVIVKEVQKTTVACDACRNQHTKCDGKFPCSFCVAKNRPCEYSEPKKRGPKRRLVAKEKDDQPVQRIERQPPTPIEESTLISLVSASTEREMLDNLEANKYFEFYIKYMSHMPASDCQELHQPKTTSKKIQKYATLAASSRILGDSNMSQKYISQARMLGGLIYDSPDPDGSAAMLVMHKYFQLVLDLPRASHYATMAASIAKMIPSNKQDPKVELMCKVSGILINEKLNNQQQARKMKVGAMKCRQLGEPMPVLSAYLEFAAVVLEVVGYHVFFASSFTLANTFQVLDNAFIGTEDKKKILTAINNLMKAAAEHCSDRPGFTRFISVFGPMYMAITEWKSGNITEALAHTMTTLNALQNLSNEKTIGLVADLPHVCIFGSLAKFLHSRGLDNLSRQMCQYIYQICDVMTPVFDFIRAIVDRFIQLNLDPPAALPSSSSTITSYTTITSTLTTSTTNTSVITTSTIPSTPTIPPPHPTPTTNRTTRSMATTSHPTPSVPATNHPTPAPSTPSTNHHIPSTPTTNHSIPSTPTYIPELVSPVISAPIFSLGNFEYRPQTDNEPLEAENQQPDNMMDNFNFISFLSIHSATPDMVLRFPVAANTTSPSSPTPPTIITTTAPTPSTLPQEYQNTDEFVHYIEAANGNYSHQPLRFDANGEVIQ